MTNDPYLSKAPAAPPNDADYDGAYAEIMATARGRRFLIEYAIRNRQPDSHVLVGTIARLEAALHDPSRQVRAAFKCDLTELAAAIARIEAEVVASGVLAPPVFRRQNASQILSGVARLGTSRRRHDCARGSSGHGSNSSDRCDTACPFRPAAAFAARRAKRFAYHLARPERGRTHRALRLALRRYHQCRNRACSTRAGSVRWRTAIFACVHSLLTIDVLSLA